MKLKIISLNLWEGGILFEEILAFLRQEDADVIALQEVYNGEDPSLAETYRSMQVLRQQLGYAYDSFSKAYLDDRQEGLLPRGNAILSKFPITETDIVFLTQVEQSAYKDIPENFPRFPRTLQLAKLETPVGIVTVGNVHGVWDLDGDSESPARTKMVDLLIKHTFDQPRVLLLGDTNAKSTNPAMHRLEEQLTSVYGQSLANTFNMRRKHEQGYASAAVDHLYVSKDIAVVTATCPDIDVSDHLPLVATVEL